MITVRLMLVSDRLIGETREEWGTGRSGLQGGAGHREEWATRRSGVQG